MIRMTGVKIGAAPPPRDGRRAPLPVRYGGRRNLRFVRRVALFDDGGIEVSDGPDLYAGAKLQIIRIERSAARVFRSQRRELAALAKAPGMRAQFLMRVAPLSAELARALVGFGAQAWRLGWGAADVRVRRDLRLAGHAAVLRDSQRTAGFAEAEEILPEIPEPVLAWYREWVGNAVGRYVKRLAGRVQQASQRGAIDVTDPDALAERIEQMVNGATGWEAERIARTETMRMWNVGHYQRLEEEPAEVLTGYEYSVVMDDRTSHICKPLEGMKIQRDDFAHLPPLHAHCRTIIEPVYSFDEAHEWGDAADVHPDLDFGVIPQF